MRLPAFIVGGTPRAGTSWIYELLDRHPGITMAKPRRPEPKFFLIDAEYDRGISYYSERWFADIPPDQVAGEKSTNYLESAVAAERIAKHLPDAKLIFVLREPAARALSNHRWSTMNGLETEDFATALRVEDERNASYPEDLRYARPYAYFERGLYAQHLRAYVERLSREQLLVLRFEHLVADPRVQAARMHSFLGVSGRPHDADDLPPVNAATGEADADPEVVAALRARYRGPNAELAELLGPDFQVWSEP